VRHAIGLTTPYYPLMDRDMQQTPRVRAFADFVGSEIKSFRALVFLRGRYFLLSIDCSRHPATAVERRLRFNPPCCPKIG
jgi:hypothetical protein